MTSVDYALDDVRYLSSIMKKQMVEIEELGLTQALKLDNQFVKTLAYCEFNGIGFDKELWLEKCEEDIKECKEIERKLDETIIDLGLSKYFGYADLFCEDPIVRGNNSYSSTINWASSKQVGALFKDIGIDISIEDNGEIKRISRCKGVSTE